MAQEHNLQAIRRVLNRNRLSLYVVRVVEICRRPLIPYVVIAFAIAFGFHTLEQRTDHQLAVAIHESCLRGNAIRVQLNQRLTIVAEDLKGKPRPHLIPLADCNKTPRP